MKPKTPKCHQCGVALASRTAPPHRRKLRYEGVAHDVLVEDMPEWHCVACDIAVTDQEGDPILQAALRKHVGLLTPDQIRAGLKALKISQDTFAERIGCAAESVSRWLNGAVLQSRTYDRFMRIYFHCPEVRSLLANGSPEHTFGEDVVHGPVDLPAIRGGQKGRTTRPLRSAGG